MFKRVTYSLFAVLLAVSLTFAGNIEQQYAKKVDPNQVPQNVLPAKNMTKVATNFLGNTDYDYGGNSTVNEQVWPFDIDGDGVLDPVGTFMVRFPDVTRKNVLFLGLEGEFTTLDASDPALLTGWGVIQSIDEGPWDGHAAIMGHQGGASKLTVFNLADFSTMYFHAAMDVAQNFPCFSYLPDGTISVVATDAVVRKTSAADPLVSTEVGLTLDSDASENPVRRSPNGDYLAIVTDDGAQFVYLYTSEDGGDTWTEEVIGEQLVSPIINRPGYQPLFINFGQRSHAVDNNGVVHVGYNGYSYNISGNDTTFAFPALYWNSNHKNWIAISDEDEELDADLAPARPGNGIGNAYPTPSVSPDGQVVSVLYQAPEFVSGALNIYPGDGTGNSTPIYYTFIKHTHSANGGATFSDPVVASGEPNESDVFPTAYDWLTNDGNQYTVRYMYMVDAIPGVSLFAANNSASNDTYWAYDEFTFTAVPESVEDQELVNSFSLTQNYPNPFNPSTTIKYSVPQLTNVSLKIYDVLGKEVSTLVNAQQAQGVYEVTFDASNLASGMYIYTIQAGSFTSSKKMLLMK